MSIQLPLQSVGKDLTLDTLTTKLLNVTDNITLNNAQFIGPQGPVGPSGIDGIVPTNGSVIGLNITQPYNTVTAGRQATSVISGNGNSGTTTYTTNATSVSGNQSYSGYVLNLINTGVLSVSLGASNNIIVNMSKNQNVSEVGKTFTQVVFNTTDPVLRAALGMNKDGVTGVTSTGLSNNTTGTPWVATWQWIFPNPTQLNLGNNVTGDLNIIGNLTAGIQTAGRFTTASNISPINPSNAFYIFPNAQITGNITYNASNGLVTIGPNGSGWYRIEGLFWYVSNIGTMVWYAYTSQTTAVNFIAASSTSANTNIMQGGALMYLTAGSSIGVGTASYNGGALSNNANWTIVKVN